MKKLYTERHGGIKPRIAEVLNDPARSALLTLVCARMDEEWFGLAFPERCSDGYAYAGTDFAKLKATMTGYGLLWPREPVDPDAPPDDGAIFDLVEFSYEYVAEALDPEFHSYMSHSHYTYDPESGRQKFALDVNRIFERNGMAFELVDGEVIRLVPAVIDDELGQALFQTGDAALDRLLETARHKFLNRSTDVRREALEKLWDAWERLKTLEPGKDKKASTAALLDKVSSEPVFRACLEHEATRLTEIGNTFMIRHTEVNKVPIVESSQIDYLFSRMFALTRLLLNATGRGG